MKVGPRLQFYVQKRRVDISREAEYCKGKILQYLERNYASVDNLTLDSALHEYSSLMRYFLVRFGEVSDVELAEKVLLAKPRARPLTEESKKVLRSLLDDNGFASFHGVAAISVYCAIVSLLKDVG